MSPFIDRKAQEESFYRKESWNVGSRIYKYLFQEWAFSEITYCVPESLWYTMVFLIVRDSVDVAIMKGVWQVITVTYPMEVMSVYIRLGKHLYKLSLHFIQVWKVLENNDNFKTWWVPIWHWASRVDFNKKQQVLINHKSQVCGLKGIIMYTAPCRLFRWQLLVWLSILSSDSMSLSHK